MNRILTACLCLTALAVLLVCPAQAQGKYKNFHVAVYARVYEVELMSDPSYLNASWKTISSQVGVDKVYIETHRDRIVADDATIEAAKAFFASKGVETAGGIALVFNERNRFQTPDYTNPQDRAFVKSIVEHTAKHFNEIILDDFFFSDTKTDSDIRAKGRRSWTQFRLDLMREVARDLILKPARAVNPRVKVIIKFPNWYEHFQGMGYDLDQEPKMFDGIYTGTETRRPDYNAQHLQQYQGYGIIRYFDNIAPGRNGGGWVDTGGMEYADRYAEQLWLTLFAKAPEITLFDWRQMLQPVSPSYRAAWQGNQTSFDFDSAVAPYLQPDGSYSPNLTMARIAGVSLSQVDPVVGQLGDPVGIATYKPYESLGDDFLQNYFGMIGIPMDIRPAYPAHAPIVFLTESAKYDPNVVAEIKASLETGRTVIITSGLLRALQGRGFEDIAEWRVDDRKVLTDEFFRYGGIDHADKPILLPQIDYITNDSWELLGASDSAYPVILQTNYSKGVLDVLAVPDNPADLYDLPASALTAIRNLFMAGSFVKIDGPAKVALFCYSNNTFIVEAFLPTATPVTITVADQFSKLRDLVSGDALTPDPPVASPQPQRFFGGPADDRPVFTITLKPHSYRAFVAEK